VSPVIHTLSELVKINTVNPAYGDGGSEANVIPYLTQFFAQHGLRTFTQEVFPGRHNLIAVLPGQTDRRIILEAHTDTVSIKNMSMPPFEPTLRDGRLYGRGSVDDKAGLAAMMHALVEIKSSGQVPVCEVWLAAVVDEEYSYRGVVKLCEDLQAEAAIVAEPTEMRAVIASKGVLRWRIHTRGKAAHSAKPQLGTNAIYAMRRVLDRLEAEHERLSHITHPLLTSPTLSVGTIHGGVQVNLVPDHCAIEVDRRLMPGESADAVFAQYAEMLRDLAEAESPPLLVDEALCTPADAAVCAVAHQVLAAQGLNPEFTGVPFGSDASKLARIGIPTIVFGPGSIDQAHTHDEYVPVDEVLAATAFYKEFILRFA
jgi:acetylornithine deacetylase